MVSESQLASLESDLEGEFEFSDLARRVYATDASAYQEMPIAVAWPKSESDLERLIAFANENGVGLIPRTAGTSLAGQVVGSGIVVDVSRHFTEILEINAEEHWVRVQPGVIRNELNMALQPSGLLFGPETSTQNRAMIGGMVGNNSCGSNSVKYGSTRDHLLEAHAILADGSKAVFRAVTADEFQRKCETPTLEGRIYQQVRELLQPAETRAEIEREFPKPSIPRRNTGYAIDLLSDADVFDEASQEPFNFCKLIAGSEGTLCFITEVKLQCLPLPPIVSGLQCAHFETVDEALRATRVAVQFDCYACELIDRFVLDCTKRSPAHRENRFFLQGEPGAVLVTEIRGNTETEVREVTDRLEAAMRAEGLGHAFTVLFGDDTRKIWDLRTAGLGLMSNKPGDEKPASVIEDTAVDVVDLPEYIAELTGELKERFGIECVQYAHAGSGEIHLRPVLNLKTAEGQQRFRDVAQCVAKIVKKYRGSLSGEHGDGRLRGEFIEEMVGEKNFALIQQVKTIWDAEDIFNPGKIVNTPIMNQQLRYQPGQPTPALETVFDWTSTNGMLGAAEMCTGSADCRKTHLTGGVMCPSYMATRNEKDTTRARANMLRQVLSEPPTGGDPLANDSLKSVLDLCLSCKGCKRECPSSVDMAKLKAEFLQHYYDAHGAPRRARRIAEFAKSQAWAARVPWLYNALVRMPFTRKMINRILGFHPDRTLPQVAAPTVTRWLERRSPDPQSGSLGEVGLFVDEFTNYSDPLVGQAAVELLEGLGYQVRPLDLRESGRSWLSKGFVREASQIIRENVQRLKRHAQDGIKIIGLEPSALLTYRDEALELSGDSPEVKADAMEVAKSCMMLEEFLVQEAEAGRVSSKQFTSESRNILLHGHCFQKAMGIVGATKTALSLPANYEVEEIPSGCCGMAGSFGYEREHFELSQSIGELVLFPAVRSADAKTIVAAAGTSCRHQLKDGVGRTARHPAEILRDALA